MNSGDLFRGSWVVTLLLDGRSPALGKMWKINNYSHSGALRNTWEEMARKMHAFYSIFDACTQKNLPDILVRNDILVDILK